MPCSEALEIGASISRELGADASTEKLLSREVSDDSREPTISIDERMNR